MTVSKVLRGQTKGVRADAAERSRRIRRIARQLGYRPNTAARQMRSRCFGAAGIVSRQTIGLFHFNMVKGVMRGLAAHNMHTIQAEIDFARKIDPAEAPRIMRELCIDGIIIDDARNIAPELMDQLTSMGVPAVFVNTAGDHDCVDPDDYEAAFRLTRMVIEAGHRKIGCLGALAGDPGKDPRDHYSTHQRPAGCRDAAAEVGLSLDEHSVTVAESVDAAYALLSRRSENTAWICTNNYDAMRLCLAAERAHLRIPRDLSIVTFRNMKPADDAVIPLTAMENPMIDVGIAAADMLVRKIENPAERLPVQRIPWIGPHGRTLAPPPEAPDFCHPTGDATVAPANDNVTHRPSVSVDASDTSHEGE